MELKYRIGYILLMLAGGLLFGASVLAGEWLSAASNGLLVVGVTYMFLGVERAAQMRKESGRILDEVEERIRENRR